MAEPTESIVDKSSPPELSSVPVLFKNALVTHKAKLKSIAAVASIPVTVSIVSYLVSLISILWPISIILALVSFIVSLLFYPAVFFAFISDSSGDLVSLTSEFYKKAVDVFWPYAGVLSLVILAVLGGGLLLIIPAIFVSVQLSFSVFAILDGQKRGKEALALSWQYVKGNWWRVFWRFTALFIAIAVVQGIINSILRSVFPASPLMLPEGVSLAPQWLQTLSVVSPSPMASIAGGVFNSVFFTPFTIIYSFLIYQNLKRTIEPAEMDEKKVKWVRIFLVLGMVALGLIILGIFVSAIFALVNLRSLYQ